MRHFLRKVGKKQNRQWTYYVTLRHFLVTIVEVGKQSVLYIVSVRVSVASVMQHAMRVGHIVMCDLHRYKNFFHIVSQTARFSRKKVCLNIKCVFRVSLQHLSETFFIRRRIERDGIKNVFWSSTLFLSDFNTWIFLDRFSKTTQIPVLMKIWPLKSRVFACCRTDRYDQANIRFSQFCKRVFKVFVRTFSFWRPRILTCTDNHFFSRGRVFFFYDWNEMKLRNAMEWKWVWEKVTQWESDGNHSQYKLW
jgi:hypothetical protein